MGDSNYHHHASCLSGFSKTMLILVNMALVAAGALIVYFSQDLNSSGWIDVFENIYSWLNQVTLYTILGFGALTICIALAGCFGACNENKCLLNTYLTFLILSLVIFVATAIACFWTVAIAGNWKSSDFPASNSEPAVGENFNRLYCLSQATFYCNEGNVTEALALFFPPVFEAVGATFNQISGISTFCNNIGNQASVVELQTVCDACAATSEYKNYAAVYEWAQSECPLNLNDTEVAAFCTLVIESGLTDASQSSETPAPYSHCRESALTFWQSIGQYVGISATCLSVLLITLIVFVCVTKRSIVRSRERKISL